MHRNMPFMSVYANTKIGNFSRIHTIITAQLVPKYYLIAAWGSVQ